MTDAPVRTLYPRRRLDAPLTVFHSSRLKYPKLHIVEDCDGLARTPEEARAQTTFTSVLEAATVDWARPCRLCALESVVITLGDPKGSPTRDTYVTFTSQASPRNQDASPLSFHWFDSTDSGVARLKRLARRLRLDVTGTISGPVAYGLTTSAGAAAIAANLRSVVKPGLDALPDAHVISTLWTLLGDAPPELAERLGEEDALDAWTTATLLAR